MALILAGRIETEERAADVRAALGAAGVAAHDMQTFYVNPPGQHDRTPIGGDRDESPGAEQANVGQATGAAAGAALGAVAGVVAAVAAPLAAPAVIAGLVGVGAHTGGLAGAMRSTESGEHENENEAEPAVRRGGLMLAVHVAEPERAERIVALLRAHRLGDLERAQGEWRDGDWVDFDPLRPPQPVDTETAGQ